MEKRSQSHITWKKDTKSLAITWLQARKIMSVICLYYCFLVWNNIIIVYLYNVVILLVGPAHDAF